MPKNISHNRKQIGALGEKLASEYLIKKGYRILETNYCCRVGEIDIVARDKDYLVIVEVRTKTGSRFGTPEESIGFTKKEKLVSLALAYLQSHKNSPSLWRIDVVAIELDRNMNVTRMELIQNALS